MLHLLNNNVFVKTGRFLYQKNNLRTLPNLEKGNLGMNSEEILIPVPWGHIAAKWWNRKDNLQPILCIHGWQNNCGAFDLLIPLLSHKHSYLAIDYPGHGLSSWIPEGMFYHFSDAVLLIRRIQKYFGWSKLSFLGHSLGAQAGFLYASLFPQEVNYVIELDALKPYSAEPGSHVEKTAAFIENHLRYEKLLNSPRSFTYEELLQKIYSGNRKQIDFDKCKYLLYRTIKQSIEPGKYILTRDLRIRNGNMFAMQHNDLKKISDRVLCPLIMIRTIGSAFPEKEKYLQEVVQILKTTNKYFQYVEVEGNHFVYLNQPENICSIINNFLEKNTIVSELI